MPTPREQFARTLLLQSEEHAAYIQVHDKIDAEFKRAVILAGTIMWPRRKAPSFALAQKWIGEDGFKRILAEFQEKSSRLVKGHDGQRAHFDVALRALAPAAELHNTDAWLEAKRVYASTYSTQGFSAEHYARGNAELLADHGRFHGVGAKVERVEVEHESKVAAIGRWQSIEFVVSFQLEGELDLHILRLRSPPPLREQVRLCWKRGVDPRVYNPFLPHGYEEQEGLDRFGGEVKKP